LGRAFAGPSVESNVMVITTGGKEDRTVAVALGYFEPERVAVKFHGALEIGHGKVNMTDAYFRMYGGGHG
jgi:hypothetical protein